MKVICTLPNAALEISGVRFSKHELGVISDDLSDEAAQQFLAVPGYVSDGPAAPKAPPRDELAALRAEAEALGIEVKGNWKEARLRTEISARKAENEAAAAAAATAAGADKPDHDDQF